MKKKRSKGNRAHYHHGNLKESLVKQAIAFLQQNPVSALTMRGLAALTGVSRTAAYAHFENKEDLLDEVALYSFNRLYSRLEDSAGLKTSARRRIKIMCLDYIEFALGNSNEYRLMFGGALEGYPLPRATVRSAECIELLAAGCRDCLPGKTPAAARRAAALIWPALHGYISLRQAEQISTGKDSYVDFALAGAGIC